MTPHLDNVIISLYNSCVADCDILSVSSLKDNRPRGLVQTIFGKISVIVTLGGGGGGLRL